MHVKALMRQARGQVSSSRGLHIALNSIHGGGAGFPTVSQVEDEAGIADCITSEPGRSGVSLFQMFFN